MTQHFLANGQLPVTMENMRNFLLAVAALSVCFGSEQGASFRYFGRLPEFTSGAGEPQAVRVPLAVDMGGRLPDMLMVADSRLWFYINESKRGKILFSEPFVLHTVAHEEVAITTAVVVRGNELLLQLADGRVVHAAVVGEDVPMLQLGAPALESEWPTEQSAYAVADFDGDGEPDRVVGGDLQTHPYSELGVKCETE